ncbi:MAG: Gfo/Idh/MocA family oxidoreductase [Pseudomonadota bacterium]
MAFIRPIRTLMIGGGKGAFIGSVHRMAMRLDGHYALVGGAFSSRIAVAQETGEELGLDPARVSSDWQALLQDEAARPPEEQAELVSIVTPNHLHVPVAVAALSAGFHVVSDKPAARDLSEALELAEAVSNARGIYALTHTYLGYPMVKEARERVRRGDLGRIRSIDVRYPQGWLSAPIENDNSKQASWRVDPALSGPAGCMGDIGTHAATLAEYISGQSIEEVCANVRTVVDGRRLDDDGAVLLRFTGGAAGVLTASQICNGEENALQIRIYGETGGLEWHQMEPQTLIYRQQGKPAQIIRAGTDQEDLSEVAKLHCRLPAGHPEGYIEAFANIYTNVAHAISGSEQSAMRDVPGIACGLAGHQFVDAVLRSSNANSAWTKVEQGGPN